MAKVTYKRRDELEDDLLKAQHEILRLKSYTEKLINERDYWKLSFNKQVKSSR